MIIEAGRLENPVAGFSLKEEERAFLQRLVDDYNADGNFEIENALLNRFENVFKRRSLPLIVFWAVTEGVLVTKSLINKREVELSEFRKKILPMAIAGLNDKEIGKSLKLAPCRVRDHLKGIYSSFAEWNPCRIAALVASRKEQMPQVFEAIGQYLPTA